jgi:nucleoside-diphosphate-sugar epimerase
MRVLVTGGGGFIGSHLVDSQLEQGNLVRTVDLHVERLAHVSDHPNLHTVVGDIADPDLAQRSVEEIDIVYHLASAHLDVRLPDTHYRRVNVEGARDLAEAARAAGVQKMVHCSSVGVIGNVEGPPADESSPCHPSNIYEQTKLAGEGTVLEFARETGLALVVARPAWVYGPRCPRTEKLFRAIRKGRFVLFGRGRNLRHPVYVSDVVRGLELCARQDNAAGSVYILAGPSPVTVKALLDSLAEVLQVPPPAIHLPVALGKAAGTILQATCKPLGMRPPFSRRSMDFFLKNNAYDTTKARDELGFRPQVMLHEGLLRTLEWMNGHTGRAVG